MHSVLLNLKIIGCVALKDDTLISTSMTTVESNLRASWSWNMICIMDWGFTKPSTVRPRFLS